MSEEKEGFFSQIKNQIIATIGVIITAAGRIMVSNMENIFSPSEPEEVVTDIKSDSIQEPKIIINIPEQKPVEKTVIVKEVPVKVEKEKEDVDW